MVVDVFGRLWMFSDGCGCFWMVVDVFGWLWMVVVGTSEDSVLVVSSTGVVWRYFTVGLYTLSGLLVRSGGTALGIPRHEWSGDSSGVLV